MKAGGTTLPRQLVMAIAAHGQKPVQIGDLFPAAADRIEVMHLEPLGRLAAQLAASPRATHRSGA